MTAPAVRMTDKRSHTMGSLGTKCTGDAPGTGKGIKSGTTESVCHPKAHSATVRIEGKNTIRDGDQWWMNNRNTIGRLVYVQDKSGYEETPAILPTRSR